jgi:hypothetical protein
LLHSTWSIFLIKKQRNKNCAMNYKSASTKAIEANTAQEGQGQDQVNTTQESRNQANTTQKLRSRLPRPIRRKPAIILTMIPFGIILDISASSGLKMEQ